jgi:hypothetical protein
VGIGVEPSASLFPKCHVRLSNSSTKLPSGRRKQEW